MFLQKNGSFLLDTPTRRANHDETEDGGQVVTSQADISETPAYVAAMGR